MAYLNVDEIEVAIETLARAQPNVTELIQLPNATSEGRHSHALRIGPPDAPGLDAVVITGGLHAREWVPPDALVNLAADLLEAHAGGTGLRYGGQRFSADDIGVVAGCTVLFPCVNPMAGTIANQPSNVAKEPRRVIRTSATMRRCRHQPQFPVGFSSAFRGEFGSKRIHRSLRPSSLCRPRR